MWNCSECKSDFNGANSIESHILFTHVPLEVRRKPFGLFRCRTCDEALFYFGDVIDHIGFVDGRNRKDRCHVVVVNEEYLKLWRQMLQFLMNGQMEKSPGEARKDESPAASSTTLLPESSMYLESEDRYGEDFRPTAISAGNPQDRDGEQEEFLDYLDDSHDDFIDDNGELIYPTVNVQGIIKTEPSETNSLDPRKNDVHILNGARKEFKVGHKPSDSHHNPAYSCQPRNNQCHHTNSNERIQITDREVVDRAIDRVLAESDRGLTRDLHKFRSDCFTLYQILPARSQIPYRSVNGLIGRCHSSALLSSPSSTTNRRQKGQTDVLHHKAIAYQCMYCTYQTSSSRSQLLRHEIRSHLKLKPFLCTGCPSMFHEAPDVLLHVRYRCDALGSAKQKYPRHHDEEKRKKRTCDNCGYSFHRRNLARHHSICSKRLTGARSSIDSQVENSEADIYVCDICSMQSFRRIDLQYHIVGQHLEKKLCQCPDCGRKFLNTELFTSHACRLKLRAKEKI